MAKKQFKAESKRLLDLMINSIYTHKEIFLRELISNASDAIDKIYYKTLSDDTLTFNKEDYYIRLEINKNDRILKITDTGIGMTKEELESNLGTIAKSGSLAFKNENEAKDGVDIIGQFGVGFYSAFMVAEKVAVRSKAFGANEAFMWESNGTDGYTVEPCEKTDTGTEITLKIKADADDVSYSEYLDSYALSHLVKKYSDFIKYPIKMLMEKRKLKDGSDSEYETYFEDETLNSMVPIWRKNKNELTKEDYDNFYTEKRYGFEKPLKAIHASVDGVASYNTILYIPKRAPYDFYTKEFEKGLELYSNGVLIMNKCADLLPDYFSFVQGLVDSPDLSLNISREMLQHDRQLQFIAKKIRDKIKSELLNLLKNDRETYVEFFNQFGKTLKFGVYSDFGAHKDILQDLLMFYSSKEDKLITLDEYVSKMAEDQKYIYYVCGESIDRVSKLPQTERVKDRGYEILYCTDEVDEFALQMLMRYKDKEFKSVSSGDLGLDDETNTKENEELFAENKELFQEIKNILGDAVKEVKASLRLKSHPVCLSSGGGLSIEMEKVLRQMPNNDGMKAEKILEINANHAVFDSLKSAYENDKDTFSLYVKLLYNQAMLIEGLPIDDPVSFTNDICKLMK
ncbi:MAG: molecular chaperone HtpG [Clostridia bacterium]|nr:molecular chaperone HtpG [Clostridia bacterium]